MKPKEKKRQECNAPICIIYPIEKENSYAPINNCDQCELEYHLRCEGLVDYTTQPYNYCCTKCEGGTKIEQKKKIETAQEIVDKDLASVERDIMKTETTIKNMEDKIEENLGKKQKILKESFKKLGISPSQYFAKSFGGSLEGNQVQQVLEEARQENWIMTEAMKEHPEIEEKYKVAISCLAKIDTN